MLPTRHLRLSVSICSIRYFTTICRFRSDQFIVLRDLIGNSPWKFFWINNIDRRYYNFFWNFHALQNFTKLTCAYLFPYTILHHLLAGSLYVFIVVSHVAWTICFFAGWSDLNSFSCVKMTLSQSVFVVSRYTRCSLVKTDFFLLGFDDGSFTYIIFCCYYHCRWKVFLMEII